ncbi:Uncharacterized protein APZ42_009857, partial [Daphnia magna]
IFWGRPLSVSFFIGTSGTCSSVKDAASVAVVVAIVVVDGSAVDVVSVVVDGNVGSVLGVVGLVVVVVGSVVVVVAV